MEKYLPEDMRLEETSARRSLMSSSQREQLERLLVDDNKVEGKVEVVEEEGRRRSTRRSTTISYQLPSESEESDLEEMVVTKDSTKTGANVEDRHEKGLQALEELETFDFGVKPSASQTRAHKAGLSISISRPRQAAVKRKTKEILEIVGSSEEEEEVVQLEERKTRSGRISRKPTEVAQMPSKSQKKSGPVTKRGRFGNGGRRRKDESDSNTDDDDGDEDDDVLVEMEEGRSRRKRIGSERSERSDKKEPELIMRRALRSSTRTVHTVDID